MKKIPVIQYFKLSHNLIQSKEYQQLSHAAKIILIHSMQFYYDDQPDRTFTLTLTTIEKTLHFGRTTIVNAISNLLDNKYWFLIKQGDKHNPNVYAHNHALLSVYKLI